MGQTEMVKVEKARKYLTKENIRLINELHRVQQQLLESQELNEKYKKQLAHYKMCSNISEMEQVKEKVSAQDKIIDTLKAKIKEFENTITIQENVRLKRKIRSLTYTVNELQKKENRNKEIKKIKDEKNTNERGIRSTGCIIKETVR